MLVWTEGVGCKTAGLVSRIHFPVPIYFSDAYCCLQVARCVMQDVQASICSSHVTIQVWYGGILVHYAWTENAKKQTECNSWIFKAGFVLLVLTAKSLAKKMNSFENRKLVLLLQFFS
jgi:hypothetical protein